MYESSHQLRPPPADLQQLWRYFPLEYLVDLLESHELFFTHIPAFSDGLEDSLTRRTRERLATWFHRNTSNETMAWEKVKEYEQVQKDFFASCWHVNDHESYLMWKAYADRGYAVRTTLARVQASFERFNGVVTGGVVEYVDFERDVTDVGHAYNLVTTKDAPYKDEREFRLLIWQSDPKNSQLVQTGNGVRVPVDLRMLIECVYVNPKVTNVPSHLLALLERHGISIDSSSIKLRSST